MNIEPYIVLGVVSWVIIIAGVSIFAKSTLRFVRDSECQNAFMSILISLAFMAIPYTLFLIRDLDIIESYHSEISYLIYFCMIIVGVFFLRAANNLDAFSKKYCFNCPEKRRRK